MQQLGKYQLIAPLGQGGMGAVYRSFHPILNRPVALKLMLGNLADDPQAQQRFLREAQVVAALSHPHIINIFDVDVQDGRPYIVMDFIEGGSLADRLRAGPLDQQAALALATPLAEALDYAHRQGLVHRDLKPANVLLRPDGSPVLADFGLARQAQADSAAQITATGAVLGTLAYIAPEQFSGRPTDARADIYAFGVLLYELLTGKLPFAGDSAQMMYGHLQQPPPPPRTLRPDLPDALEQLILRMLAKDPAARPQSMAEVAAMLRAIDQGQAVGAATGPTVVLPPQAERAGREFPRLLVWAGLAALGLVGLVAVGALLALWPARRSASSSTPIAITLPTVALPSVGELDPQPTSGAAPAALSLIDAPLLAEAAQVGPEAFSIGGVSVRKDEDSAWFFGEVRNDGDQPRESVQVRVVLRDAGGNELASKRGTIELGYLAPGQVSPFSILFSKDDAPPPFASYDLEVRSSEADFQLGYSYRDLSIVAEPAARRDSLGFIKVSGRVRNTGEQPARFVQIFAVFYDNEGAVVGVASSFAESSNDQPLAAGEEARFEISGVVFSGTPTRYRLLVEASRVT